MADRIIKSDSGNDVVIQNNTGSRKIEVTNSGDVEVTGDVKTTTVKATNLKANDGTASLEIADSTGDIGFSANTNLKIKLPSAGGIYESDGSTQVITESGGSVTIENATFNGTIGASATFTSGQTKLIGVSWANGNSDGNVVTLANNQTYHAFGASGWSSSSWTAGGVSFLYAVCVVDGSGSVTITHKVQTETNIRVTPVTNGIYIDEVLANRGPHWLQVFHVTNSIDNS